MIVLYFLTVIVVIVFGNDVEKEDSRQARLLLHTDLDLAQQIVLLTNRLDAQQANLTILTDKNTALSKHVEAQQANITSLAQVNADLKKEIQALKSAGSGSTYTRWGRTTCPGNGTERVYEGYMGGSTYTNTGGGTNYLCLSSDPQWDHYDETIKAPSTIVGVEYDFDIYANNGVVSQFFGKDIYQDDAPCAVCLTKRSTTIMIPGRTGCYSGWTKEYSGYILGQADTYDHPTEWVCLDRRPDVVVGGKTNDNEGVLSLTEASCGKSLECPPYVNGREITCVVCSL
ncbi:hypothetical protein ACF0H5_016758 [Mactra antiquata]